MNAIQLEPTGLFPLKFIFVMDGSVVLQHREIQPLVAIVDTEKEIKWIAGLENLLLWKQGDEEPLKYLYNTAYKLHEVPTLKQWLQQLDLPNPIKGEQE